jgi:hypothetical protein
MGPAEVRRFCQFSTRAYHRVLKLARAIADLADGLGFGWPTSAPMSAMRPGSRLVRGLGHTDTIT